MIRMAINHIPCFAQYIHMAKDNGHFCCGKKLFCHWPFFPQEISAEDFEEPCAALGTSGTIDFDAIAIDSYRLL